MRCVLVAGAVVIEAGKDVEGVAPGRPITADPAVP
jgi:hypothetical protein